MIMIIITSIFVYRKARRRGGCLLRTRELGLDRRVTGQFYPTDELDTATGVEVSTRGTYITIYIYIYIYTYIYI